MALLFNTFKSSFVIQRPVSQVLRCASNRTSCGPIESTIEDKLRSKFQPQCLRVLNESHMHNVAKGSETHFRVVIVSTQFQSLTTLQRHRLVNDVLRQELSDGVHALAIQAMTPDQWEANRQTLTSPNCRGGMGL